QIGGKAGQLLLHTRDTLPRVFRIARIENADDALFDPLNEVFVDREAIAVMCDLRQVDVKAPSSVLTSGTSAIATRSTTEPLSPNGCSAGQRQTSPCEYGPSSVLLRLSSPVRIRRPY